MTKPTRHTVYTISIVVMHTMIAHQVFSAQVLTDNNDFTEAVLFGIKEQISKALDAYINRIYTDIRVQGNTEIIQQQHQYIKETLEKINQSNHYSDILGHLFDFDNNYILSGYNISATIDDLLVYR